MNSIWKNNTWDLEPLPLGQSTIICKWVFKIKPGVNEVPPVKKTRLIAHGFEQKHGIDFYETFTPVIKWATLCTAIALAAAKRMDIHHMDVRTAFLHGIFKERVFMQQPPGFRVHGKETMVCKLYKSLYGLKQSPHTWYECIDAALLCLGLKRITLDGNLYYLHQDGKTLILLLYVDDLFITGNFDSFIS